MAVSAASVCARWRRATAKWRRQGVGAVQQWGERRAASVRAQGPEVSIRESSRDTGLAGEVADAIPNASVRITHGAFEIGNGVDEAKGTATQIGKHVQERNDAWITTTLPGVESIRDTARDRLGIGQGTSHVYELPRGERATLPISGRLTSNMGGRVDPDRRGRGGGDEDLF